MNNNDKLRIQNDKSGFMMTVVIILIALLTLRYAFDIDVLEYLKPVWEYLKTAIRNLGARL